MSSPVSESLMDIVVGIPIEQRKVVLKSVLRSAGPEVEELVLRRKGELVRQGVSPRDAFVEAIGAVIQRPEGQKILRVLAVAAAHRATETGSATLPYEQERDRLESILRQGEGLELGEDDGLGFVSAIIAAVAAVVSVAASAISSAVSSASKREQARIARLTPLTRDEAEEIAAIVAPKYQNYEKAESEVLDLINEKFGGERGRFYLMDPVKDFHVEQMGVEPGHRVNEYKQLVILFEIEKRRIEEAIAEQEAEAEAARLAAEEAAQEAQEAAQEAAQEEAGRRKWLYGGAAVLGVAAVGTLVALSQ